MSATPKINLLVYGWPGSGKTTLLGTGPTNTLIIRPPTDHVDPIRRINPDIEQIIVPDWAKMMEVMEWLRDTGGDGYDWVWLDSISLWQDTGLDDVWDAAVERNPRRKLYGLDKQEYGINMFRLAQWCRHIVGAAAFNFGITAHPAEMTDPFSEDEIPDDILLPYIQGKNMSSKICGYMNIVAYLRVARDNKTKELKRVLHATHTERWYGKDQFDCLPNGKMVNPTLPRLIKAVEATAGPTKKKRTATRRRSG